MERVVEHAWELAVEVVEEGSRARLGGLGQLGELPAIVAAFGHGRPRKRLEALVREHARSREASGFTPRELVGELLLVGTVLRRFGCDAAAVDAFVGDCVAAYVERATAELALRARQDALTGLLNHQAFTQELEVELERAKRYDHPLALVFFDVDRFKAINDTLGHPDGDRVLRAVAGTLEETLRRTDVAGRMGGDEFAAVLVETEPEAAGHVLARLVDRLDELAAAGELPAGFSISPGMAHYPADGAAGDALFRAADARSYDVKRARSSAA
jgi:diguanylate cyclase (GGDEF)-like protein